MAEEKQGFEQLSQDDLNNVKAGIPPYESPVIVDLTPLGWYTSCSRGIVCTQGTGSSGCDTGRECTPGIRQL